MSTANQDALVQAMVLPAILIGADKRIRAANASARALLGAIEEGALYGAVLRKPRILEAIERVFAGGMAEEGLVELSEATRVTQYTAHCSPVHADAGLEVLVMLEDRGLRDEAGLMRRDFVANVSHELKTPLTALLGFIETLKGPARDDAKAREKFLVIMEEEATRMQNLVQDLLSLSRVEEDERVRPEGRCDLGEILTGVTSLLEPFAKARNTRLELRLSDQPQELRGASDQLRQVFTNLIENAIKYGHEGGEVVISTNAPARDATLRGPAVRIDVQDDGPGIARLHLPRLTERFYRVDSHRARQMGGTGLGLAIVKHIVSRHRGRLEITSTPGEGSRFSVILPTD